jgi:hypothetical protein
LVRHRYDDEDERDYFTFATTDSKIGMSAFDSDVPNAGSMTFLCLLWISPIKDVIKRHESRKKENDGCQKDVGMGIYI